MMRFRRITTSDYIICQRQGDIYKDMAEQGTDMEWFSNAYLKSDFCKRAFDTIWSRFQWADSRESLDFIIPEISPVKENKQGFFNPDVAQWIGLTYRMLYIETKIPSAELCDIVSFDAMCGYYPGLHTLDEEMAIDMICEDFHLAFDEESLAEGKRIERMVDDGSIYPLLEEMEQQMREENEREGFY